MPFLQPQDASVKIFGKRISHALTHPLFGILLSLLSVTLSQSRSQNSISVLDIS